MSPIRLRQHAAPALVAGLVALLGIGCASEADLSSIRREQRELARKLADTRADVESLRVQLSRLRGQIEDRRSRTSSRTSSPAADDIEQRLRALEMSSPPRSSEETSVVSVQPEREPVPPGAEFGERPAERPEPLPPAMPASGSPISVEADIHRSESPEYRTGLAQYQRGEPQKAVQTLRSYVNKNPKNEAVPYAQYWIGESYYQQGKFNEAILAYNEILVGFPKSDRVPAALLRQAAAFAELGDKIDARLILQKLIADHPNSPEAARAKRELLALGN
ncbi:MAG TPA: tol-pal system protein YbgF [Candidatus Binatia bacterium]